MPEQSYSEEEVQQLIKEAKEGAVADTEAKVQARASYGDSVGAGGATPSRSQPRRGSWEESNELIQGRLERGDGLGDSTGKMAFAKWIGRRIGEAAEFAQRTPSYRSFSRGAPDDTKIKDDRIARRSKQGGSL